MSEEVLPQWVRRDQSLHTVGDHVQSVEVSDRQSLDRRDLDTMAGAENLRSCESQSQLLDQLLLILDRSLPLLSLAVNGQGLLQRGEHVGVVHDQSTWFFGVYAVGPGDRLHQRVVPHRL